MQTLRRLGVFVFAASLACAGKSTPELPVDALYEPPAPIPIRVGLKSDNSLPSQLYGGAVIRESRERKMNAARRAAQTRRFARTASARLRAFLDPRL